MSKGETLFWKEIDKAIGHKGHFERIESRSTSPGQPDVNYCIDGCENNMELKYGFKTDMPKIRPSQVKWFRNREAAGGNPLLFTKLIDVKAGVCLRMLHKAKSIPDLAKNRVWGVWVAEANVIWPGKTLNARQWEDVLDYISGEIC